MKFNEQYIKSLPLTTNKIEVVFNREKFFSKYAIVSYYGNNKDSKHLAYEHLADEPCLSVTGIRARWIGLRFPAVHFFVLVKKGNEKQIIESLRKYDYICSRIDTLEEYDDQLQKRIIASLAINSLGKKQTGKMMYNDGSLLVCDDINFKIPKSRKELVCLKIEVNEYMNLIAQTTSFSNPISHQELFNYRNCVFKVGNDVGGFLWEGRSVKPYIIKGGKGIEPKLNELYIQKKRYRDNKNTVPYWPYNPENYSHGKLFVIWQVVNSVNEDFNGMVDIKFCDFDVLHYDQYKSGDEMFALLHNYLAGKTIFFDNPFKTSGSLELIRQLKDNMQTLMKDSLFFTENAACCDMTIKLCEPQNENMIESYYTKSQHREIHCQKALQHVIYYGVESKDSVDKAQTRRILIELLVKDSLINKKVTKQLSDMVQGWEFIRYKINNGFVHGASLYVTPNCDLEIRKYGLSKDDFGVEFEQFVDEHLQYSDYDRIRGFRDYMALKKGGNVYMIIDTDEIPILDASLIDEGYGSVINDGVTVAMFKRVVHAHEYLRGYIGFHMWKSDGIDGEPNSSYSYIVGKNLESIKMMPSTKMDKMPRARRIFILHKENPDTVESDIIEIAAMLKSGFGRWNEMMAYPFPFKFLLEYLDDACETAFSKHWKDITFRGDL